VVSGRANRELTADSANQALLDVARHVKAPVILVQGADDPRPWIATDGLLNALPVRDASSWTKSVTPPGGSALMRSRPPYWGL